MDSRLMNVFHDEPFDTSFNKYEYIVEQEFYTQSEMDLQLADTLDGILPIPPASNTLSALDAYESVTQKYDTTLQQNNQKIDLLVYDRDDVSQQQQSNKRTYDILTLDGNEYNSFDDLIEYDSQSQSSENTFRTRTDSSSIADYESHSSDSEYDEIHQVESDKQVRNDTDCPDNEQYAIETVLDTAEIGSGLFEQDEIVLNENIDFVFGNDAILVGSGSKKRTISSNTISSDFEAMGFNIDGQDFDLAEFITKDDFNIDTKIKDEPNSKTEINPTTVVTNNSNVEVKLQSELQDPLPAKTTLLATNTNVVKLEPEEEGDVYVDVESLELDEQEELRLYEIRRNQKLEDNIAYVDNVKNDPSWQPDMKTKTNGIIKKHAKNMVTPTSMPNKKLKVANAVTSAIKSKAINKESENKMKSGIEISSKDANPNAVKADKNKCSHSKETKQEQQLQNELPKVPLPKKMTPKSPIKQETAIAQTTVPVVKRKLNLEEYKQRRSNNSTNINIINRTNNLIENKPTQSSQQLNLTQSSNLVTTLQKPAAAPIKHSEAVTAIVKSLKEEPAPATDPITIAKNKVLRMQQLKRAQQMKILDNTLAAKVPRVTKLLPLKDIVKETYIGQTGDAAARGHKCDNNQKPSNYKAIVMVSTGTNTEISIPMRKEVVSGTLLNKSTCLLSNIANTMQKVKYGESVSVIQNSLIASIQDEVVKKAISGTVLTGSGSKVEESITHTSEHGENKIIMHVPKNFVQRCVNMSCGTQTNFTSAFPMLPAPNLITTCVRKSLDRHVRKSNSRNREPALMQSHESDRNVLDNVKVGRDSVSRLSTYSFESEALNGAIMGAASIGSGGEYSSRSSRSCRHRSSISSSYSENESYTQTRRQHRRSYRDRTRKYSRASSNSSTDDDDVHNYGGRTQDHSYSPSRTRSRSPHYRRNERGYQNRRHNDHNVSQPAVEERRIVYVGRIEQETTKEMLKTKFLPYGKIKTITIHYKDTGMKYGFVTYERSEDAFAVIDRSNRDPLINMYDVSFGGRRAFCRSSYADLDNAGINTYHSFVFPQTSSAAKHEDSFDAMLQQVKAKLLAKRSPSVAATANLAVKEERIVEDSKIEAVPAQQQI